MEKVWRGPGGDWRRQPLPALSTDQEDAPPRELYSSPGGEGCEPMSTQLCSAPRALHASPSIQIGWGGSIPIFLFSVINLREETTWCSSCNLNTQWWWVSIAYFEPIISSLFSSQPYRYFALGELCSILIFTLFRLFHAVSHTPACATKY